MRILLATPMPPSGEAPGAIPRLLDASLKGLSASHEVTLVTVAGPDPWELQAADRLLAEGHDVHVVRRTAPTRLRGWPRRFRILWGWFGRRLPWRTVWFYEPEVQRLIDRLTRDTRFDVVAVEDNAMGVYRYPDGVPSILTEHEVRRGRGIRWPGRPGPGWIRRALAEIDWHRWPRYQRTVWGRFDLVQAFTRRDAEAIAAADPSRAGRVRVSPFGIDVPPPLDRAAEKRAELLFVGNMTHHPNVDSALWLAGEILPLIRSRQPGARLTIAGAHPPPEVVALEREDVRVPGWVRELRPVAERAEVVIAPIRVGGGMRMKVLEAMALGKAVVTTPRGAEGLAIDGFEPPLVVAEGAEGIAAATLDLLADPDARRDLGDAARAFVEEHHSSAAYARRLEGLYRAAAGAPPG